MNIKTLRHLKQHTAQALVLAIVGFQLIFPQNVALAQNTQTQTSTILVPNFTISENTGQTLESTSISLITPLRTLEQQVEIPVIIDEPKPEYKVLSTYTITITAYNSLPGQTDNTPCITANGYDLCEANEENVIAANFLPFGTKVRIPEKFGDRIFTVQDRMNKRYYYRADVWFRDRADAIQFGAPYTKVEVVEEI